MTSHGVPDEPRSARYILKDYVNASIQFCSTSHILSPSSLFLFSSSSLPFLLQGKLLYCHPPPGEDEQDFNFPTLPVEISTNQNSLLVSVEHVITQVT